MDPCVWCIQNEILFPSVGIQICWKILCMCDDDDDEKSRIRNNKNVQFDVWEFCSLKFLGLVFGICETVHRSHVCVCVWPTFPCNERHSIFLKLVVVLSGDLHKVLSIQ